MEPKEVLNNMIRFASELGEWNAPEMASKNNYIRIGGRGYRSVSLHNKTPLSGYSKSPSNSLDKILNEFKNKKPNSMDDNVRKKKQERCLQRYIIKKSLVCNRNMIKALSLLECPYSELIFATDEVSLGDVRCDILAVGKIGDAYYPVVIELKSNRDKEVLKEQLKEFCHKISTFKVEFNELLTCMTRLKHVRIHTDKPHKVIIWPVAPSEATAKKTSGKPHQTRQDLTKDEKISLLEYYKFDNDSDSVNFYETWTQLS